MGYITYFHLEIREAQLPDMVTAAIKDFRTDSEGAEYALEKDGTTAEGAKWYDWDTDLRAISDKWPKLLFVLSGDGESSDDRWICYAKGGKIQQCQAEIVYPEYDEERLT